MKEWTLSIKDIVKKLVKKFFKSLALISFQNGDDKTIFKNLEKQFMGVIKLKPNLCTTYIERRYRETEDRNGCY